MTKFLQKNTTINLADDLPVIHDVLPTATYALKMSPKGEIYLEEIESFSMPERLFGSIGKTAERIVNTYTDRTGVTGLLLTGEKGSGKTLLGKKVALDLMATYDMPVIVVNIPISGDDFGIFLQKLGKPVTLFFDEFEKVYGREEYQNGLLTILDGVYPVKMMAILTANDSSKMIQPLIDRPGRVYYKIDYSGLEYAFIMEYAETKLVNKSHLPELGRLATMSELNFDQLQALIEEMNRYDESVKESVQLLNISIGTKDQSMNVIRMSDMGKAIPSEAWNSPYFYGNITTLGQTNEYGDTNEISFGYLTPLSEPQTINDYYRQMMAEGKGYDRVRSVFQTKIGYKQTSEPMPGVPHIMDFDSKATIEVNRAGHITLTNAVGQSVTLQKKTADYSKSF